MAAVCVAAHKRSDLSYTQQHQPQLRSAPDTPDLGRCLGSQTSVMNAKCTFAGARDPERPGGWAVHYRFQNHLCYPEPPRAGPELG